MASRVVPGGIADQEAILPQYPVDQRGFAHVRPTHHRQADHLRFFGRRRRLGRLRNGLDQIIQQIGHTVAVGRRDRVDAAKSQGVKIGHQRFLLGAVNFVDRTKHRFVDGPQICEDLPVVGRNTDLGVHQEDDGIGFVDDQLDL